MLPAPPILLPRIHEKVFSPLITITSFKTQAITNCNMWTSFEFWFKEAEIKIYLWHDWKFKHWLDISWIYYQLNFLNNRLLFGIVLGLQQHWEKNTESCHVPNPTLTLHTHTPTFLYYFISSFYGDIGYFPLLLASSFAWYICYN